MRKLNARRACLFAVRILGRHLFPLREAGKDPMKIYEEPYFQKGGRLYLKYHSQYFSGSLGGKYCGLFRCGEGV